VYRRQEKNLRYDGNLRSAIALATGKYCLLMGNDDCLANERTLERLHELLCMHSEVGVVITNYADYDGGAASRRVHATRVVPSSPGIAAASFRNFAFVSGVILDRERAVAHATADWDGSEMYQMYLGSRILAEGRPLLEVADVMVRRGISITGESVDSYAAKPRVNPCPIEERRIPLVQMGRLVYDAIRPFAWGRSASVGLRVFLQILLFTYPFWILEYRRVQSWRYSAGICLGMRPKNLLASIRLPWRYETVLRLVYSLVTCVGLLFPVAAFDALRPRFYTLAKTMFQRS
jgi:hypothetical protein